MKAKELSCVDCGLLNCRNRASKYPEFCLTLKLSEEQISELRELYEDPENNKVSVVSASIEEDFYLRYTRVEETVTFAKRMGYKKIGIATCNGLIEESRVMARILRNNGFEVYGAICKIGSFDKTSVGVPEEKTCKTGPVMCNPIGQAMVLNEWGSDFNVAIGLCVGHDSLFYKYSDALCTTLIAKDRVLAHNPAGAIYGTKKYYHRLLDEQIGDQD